MVILADVLVTYVIRVYAEAKVTAQLVLHEGSREELYPMYLGLEPP